jgi:hypothetical protein
MPHAIIRGKNGRRHQVDFGDAPVRVEIYSSEETVEIFIEADFGTVPEERRRFAILNFSTFPATSLAKPPAQQRDVPQSPMTDCSNPWLLNLSLRLFSVTVRTTLSGTPPAA